MNDLSLQNVTGRLIIISGPSGAGKGTIISEILKRNPKIALSVSCTTRKPRPGELDGINYYFLSKDSFLEGIKNGNFLEYADVFGNLYGTPKDKVMERLEEGKNVILEIDVQGANQVKRNYDDAVTVFIMPPSEEVLISRLKNRATETPEQIERRISRAKDEMAQNYRYDYIIVNDNLNEAVDLLCDIISDLNKH